jgi:hypothetical protein
MDRALDLLSLLEMAAEEARRLGFTGTLRVDASAGSLHVGDLGPMEIPPPVLARLVGKTVAQQQPIMAGVVRRFLRQQAPPLDHRYDELEDPETRARLHRNLFAIETEPGRPHSWNAVGRVERAFGVDGWHQRLRRAAELYSERAARLDAEGQYAAGAHVDAANMYRLAGLANESQQSADAALRRLDASSPAFDPRDRCAALALAGRRSEQVEFATRAGEAMLGARWWAFCAAAAAAERGDRESLRRELQARQRLAEVEEVDLDATGLGDRDMAEMLGAWFHALL